MAQYELRVDQERDLTEVTVTGKLDQQMIIDALEDFYGGRITSRMLWDLSGADLADVQSGQILRIISVAKRFAHLRPEGKTAILTSRAVDFGMARMYELTSEIENHPIQHRVFKDRDAALQWLATVETD